MLAASTTLAWIETRPIQAQEAQSLEVGFTLVAFDTSLLDPSDIEAADLAAKMVLSDIDEGLILVGQYSDHAFDPETFATSDLAKAAIDEASDRMRSNGEDIAADLSEMLESYASFIEQLGVPGKLFILSAGGFNYHESTGVPGLETVAADLAAQDVTISTISLATTPAPDRDVLAAISNAGGGTPYDLGFLGGVIEFINGELGVSLTPSLQTDNTGAAGETIDIGVPPHSSYLVAGFSFEDPETINVIRQPNGQEIADTVGSVNAFEITGMKFFTVRNPQPGFWALRSAGGSGTLTMYSDVVNNLSIEIPPQPPFPSGHPFVLEANATSGELPLIDASASVDAIITGPDGVEHSYILNDLGEDGDVFSEDGIFSATIAPQEIVGISEVRLSMRWPNLSATINGTGAFVVEPFPTIEIEIQGDGSLTEGARAHIANVDLRFDNAAFLAAQDDIEVSVVKLADSSTVEIELEPTEVVEEKVYQLRIFGILPEDGEYEFNATLRSAHLDREFVAQAPTATQDFKLTTPTPILIYSAIGVAAFLLLLFILLLLRSWLQSSPFGNLYRVNSNNERELVANFSEYRGSAWDQLFNKPIVPAAAMPGIPLHGGRFTFASRGISLRYKPDSDGLLNVMIGGEPLEAGNTPIPEGEHFQIGPDTFIFDRADASPDVQVSERLTPNPSRTQRRTRHLRPRPHDMGRTLKRKTNPPLLPPRIEKTTRPPATPQLIKEARHS